MTVLASTADHLVEFEAGILTITRRSDGHAVSLTGKGIAGHFRDCLKTHTPERVVETWIRLAISTHRRTHDPKILGASETRDADGWAPLYNFSAITR